MLKFVVVLALAAAAFAAPASQEVHQPSLLEEAVDVYSSCADEPDLTVCLKLKALHFVDRAVRSAEFNIADGLRIVQTDEAKNSRANNARSLNDIEASLPAEPEAREAAVDSAILDRAARFLSTHNVELSLADESRSLDESRGKKKKKIIKSLVPIALLLKLKALVLIPIVLGALALLAFKALILGKIALLVSGILGVQKLLASKQQNFDLVAHPVHHEEHHDHGWGRSAGEYAGTDLAYNAYKPTN